MSPQSKLFLAVFVSSLWVSLVIAAVALAVTGN